MTEIRLAPMAGITDWPFRLLCFEQGCDAATTEMISALGYVYAPKNHVATNQLLEKAPGEGKLFVQIFGKEPELMAQAAARLSQTGRFDGVDINMGCPAHKVACSGEGSGLMRDPKKAEAIIRAVVAATSLPVSVKFRLGWDAANQSTWKNWRRWPRSMVFTKWLYTAAPVSSSTAARPTGKPSPG